MRWNIGTIMKALILIALIVMVLIANQSWKHEKAAPTVGANNGTNAVVNDEGAGNRPIMKPTTDFPEKLELVAENDHLILKADPITGHFIVENKQSGSIWHSFPRPDHFQFETVSKSWKGNLRSPIMYETVDFSLSSILPKQGSLVNDEGYVSGWELIENGYRVTFHVQSKQLTIPIEVVMNDDYVETKVVDAGIVEGVNKLVSLRVFPFLGAEHSLGQEGYVFVPDGAGALMQFKESRSDNKIYSQRVFGLDLPFDSGGEHYAREQVTLPVFGMKTANTGFVAVIHEGAEYTNIIGSPSGSYSRYNWTTGEMNYRLQYFQNTSVSDRTQGFNTYNKDRFGTDRAIRYYFLEDTQANYVGMATRYRKYLIEEYGLQRVNPKTKIPIYIDILGGDTEQGFLSKRYVKATTTADASEMIKRLYGLGVENMNISYWGWQRGGYSSYGGLFPVDDHIGGNSGMKSFVDFAHSLDIPVSLHVDYAVNNTGKDGFRKQNDGLRDYGQTILERSNNINNQDDSLVSPMFLKDVFLKDLKHYKELGIDGLYLSGAIVNMLYSDYNVNHEATRTEVLSLYTELMQAAKNVLGTVQAYNPNIYAIHTIQDIRWLNDDYSYDLIVDEVIPFNQIVFHGLINYTANWVNEREQYRNEFLRSIEYGAYPSFIFMNGDPQDLKRAHGLRRYVSPDFRVWESAAVEEYQLFNEVLADVQNQFIVNHRTIAPNVRETTYENGKRIIVNYREAPYVVDGIKVPALDFIILEGGVMDEKA